MTTMSYAARDSFTMLRRNLRHMQRYPSLTIMLVGQPLVFLLLFVFVFGGTLGDGLGGMTGGREQYLAYVTPAILLITITSAALGTSISVATDATEGIFARFRTMAISRASVLTGHVLGAFLQTAFALAVVFGVAVAVGFRPAASFGGWLGTFGMLVLITVALTWLCVALGLHAKSVETASNSPMIFTLLPFLGSGFVPTDSMPAGLRWFAEYQPFTSMIESLRGMLFGTPLGSSVYLAIGWSLVIGVSGYLWSRSLFGRRAEGTK